MSVGDRKAAKAARRGGGTPGVGDIPHQLPGYRIEGQLGRGSMGVVYLAEDVRLQRKVALKVLTPSLADDQRFRERFTRESQMAATLDHPNVIPIYSAGEEGGLLYIAMRYVDGRDLRAIIDSDGPLPLERTAAIVEQIAGALDAAHARGLVHRDVKPGNILVESREGQERSYLGDFGITKSLASGGGLTTTGQFIGTIDYISPEQIQGKPVDGRSDGYALGCVVYQCLTGVSPFPRDESAAIMWGHMHDEATPVTTLRPDLPPAVDRVVAKAMAKRPEDRYATCGELAAALRAASGPSAAASLSPHFEPRTSAFGLQVPRAPSSAPTALQRRWYQRWPVIVGMAAAAVALVGVMVVVLLRLFPTAAEDTLLSEVPMRFREGCRRNMVEEDGVLAAVRCTPGGGAEEAFFTSYASQQALDSAYARVMAQTGIPAGTGDCETDSRAEQSYRGDGGRTGGRLLCYPVEGDPFIVWNETGSRTLMTAKGEFGDYEQLYQWWAVLIERVPDPAPETALEAAPGATPEETLLNQVPESFRDTCQPQPISDDAAALGARAQVICEPNVGAQAAVFTLYDSQRAMDTAYQDVVTARGNANPGGDCLNDQSAEHAYTGTTSGRVLCYQFQGNSVILWSEAQSLILRSGIVVGRTDPPSSARLYQWWAGLVGRPEPSGPSDLSTTDPGSV
ncbi:MAG: serine/threonine-protein kinase [Egibacteraceae bacterium]